VFSQFIATKEPLAPQLVILAPSALAVTIAVYVAYATLGLGVGRVLAGRRKVWFDRITGSTYLAFAFGLAASNLRRG
jgi:threonine/homoserine/homoserine lactone efflux protein